MFFYKSTGELTWAGVPPPPPGLQGDARSSPLELGSPDRWCVLACTASCCCDWKYPLYEEKEDEEKTKYTLNIRYDTFFSYKFINLIQRTLSRSRVSDHDYKFLPKFIIHYHDFVICISMFWSVDCREYKIFWHIHNGQPREHWEEHPHVPWQVVYMMFRCAQKWYFGTYWWSPM